MSEAPTLSDILDAPRVVLGNGQVLIRNTVGDFPHIVFMQAPEGLEVGDKTEDHGPVIASIQIRSQQSALVLHRALERAFKSLDTLAGEKA